MTDHAERRLDPRYSHDGDLTNRFTYHPPEPEQPEVYQTIRDLAHLWAILVEAATFPCPARTHAVTRVEEAVMWANAAIARRGLSGAGIAGAPDLIEHAIQVLLKDKPDGHLAAALSDTNPPDRPDDPWADATSPVFHEGKVAPGLLSPLVVQLDSEGVVQVRNPEVLNGRGVLVLPDGIEWDSFVMALPETPEPAEPSDWTAVCPFCPEYTRTEGQGAQRDAQEWLLDHAEQVHGKALRDG